MLAPEAHMRKMNTVKRSFSSSETRYHLGYLNEALPQVHQFFL